MNRQYQHLLLTDNERKVKLIRDECPPINAELNLNLLQHSAPFIISAYSHEVLGSIKALQIVTNHTLDLSFMLISENVAVKHLVNLISQEGTNKSDPSRLHIAVNRKAKHIHVAKKK